MRPKTYKSTFNLNPKEFPGPGAYDPKPSLNHNGKLYVAKFKSSGATRINPPKSEWFEKLHGIQVPGPGEYDPKLKTTKDGF